MPTYPIPTPIYHFTHIQNLTRLVNEGMILCKNQMQSRNVRYTSSAFESVQGQRASFPVPVSRGGTIHDYVPFYFNSLSPMLYTISCNNVDNVDMEDLVFFKSSVQAVNELDLDFAFTDGHGIMSLSDYYDDLSDLNKVPWNVINARYWTNFPDGRRLRQSEFLVYRQFNWELIEEIGVYSQEMKIIVENAISRLQQRPIVKVRKDWYF